MGTALAVHTARCGAASVLLATDHDEAVVDAWRRGLPHPTLRIPFHQYVGCRPAGEWAEVLPAAAVVLVAASSGGLQRVLAQAAAAGAPDAVWVLATKGWAQDTLQTPSQVATSVLGNVPVVSLAGRRSPPRSSRARRPGCSARPVISRPAGARPRCWSRLPRRSSPPATWPAPRTSAAFKNVVAVAVGLAEGLSDRLGESALVASFANARAAVFARGMLDMMALAEAQGGRSATVLGLAGAGDLYVTCQHGRNGRFGRLLGSGATVDGAVRSIGSTVEGVTNTAAALRLAARSGLDLPTARVVQLALTEDLTGERVSDRLRDLFRTVVSGSRPYG